VQEQFAQGAQNALEAGFDGVELHSANGYLLHEFLSAVTNLRADEYGGDTTNRCRFVVETAQLVAERVGAERVGIRLSPDQSVNDISENDAQALYPQLLGELDTLGLGYLHMMETPPDAGWSSVAVAREGWNGTLIVNSNFQVDWPLELANEIIAEGRADLVCYGRRFISNPDLVERIRGGAPIVEADFRTFYGGGAEGYTDYPPLGNES
jgi:N-ethylmaleimide reductase